jgi:hypothetical protein
MKLNEVEIKLLVMGLIIFIIVMTVSIVSDPGFDLMAAGAGKMKGDSFAV